MESQSLNVLSKYAMELFRKQFSKTRYYEVEHKTVDGITRCIIKNQDSGRTGSTVIIEGQICNCNDCVYFDIQCFHELLMDCQFEKEKWGNRHLKESVFDQTIGYNFCQDRDDLNDDLADCNDVLDLEESDQNQLQDDEPQQESTTREQLVSPSRISYKTLMEEFSDAANVAMNNPQMEEALMGTVMSLKGIMRNDPNFTNVSAQSFKELINQSKTMFGRQDSNGRVQGRYDSPLCDPPLIGSSSKKRLRPSREVLYITSRFLCTRTVLSVRVPCICVRISVFTARTVYFGSGCVLEYGVLRHAPDQKYTIRAVNYRYKDENVWCEDLI